jgi:hypothetical protein
MNRRLLIPVCSHAAAAIENAPGVSPGAVYLSDG